MQVEYPVPTSNMIPMQPCPITSVTTVPSPHNSFPPLPIKIHEAIHPPTHSFQTATCPVGTSAVRAQSCTPLPQPDCIAMQSMRWMHWIPSNAYIQYQYELQTPSHPPPMQRSHHDFTNRSPAEIDFGTYLSTLVLASLDFLYVVDQTNRAHLTSRVLLDIAYKLLLY